MDDDEDDGAGDGIGKEDGGQENEEENGDESDPTDNDLLTPDKPPHNGHPITPWLLRAYKARVAECKH